MPTINQLPTVTSLSGGDLFAVYNTGNGDARKVSATALATFVQQQSPTSQATQYVAPTSGLTVPLQAAGDQNWVIMTPATSLASVTLVMPAASSLSDRTEILVVTTRQINNVSYTLNGATAIYGNPGVLAAEDYFTLKYDNGLNSWFRVA